LVGPQAEDEQLIAFRNWWAENGTSLLIAIAVAIAAVVGWRWYGEHRQTQIEAASAVYQQYLEARASNAETEELLARLDNDFPKSSYRVFTLFYRAADAAKAEKYSEAAPLLEQAIDVAPDAKLKDVARLRYAKVLAQMGEYQKALDQLSSIRGEGFRSAAAEAKGDILIAQGDVEGAREAYQAAVDANADAVPGAPASARQDAVLQAKLADATRNAPAAPADTKPTDTAPGDAS
jgi:predicted negative regulator of RcsB-dependent stress response